MLTPSSTSHLIVTNCTARKRRAADSLQLTGKLVESTIEETARNWRAALAAHGPRLRVQDLYMGRSMADAKQVAAMLDASLYVASAGLGLVRSDQDAAPYDLTTSGPTGGLQDVLRRSHATSKQWWSLLCQGRGLAHLLAQHPRAVLMAALPASYVEMVIPDLAACPSIDLQRVRLFTSPAGTSGLPPELAGMAMPYDERLESITGYAGTRADFPQRAMRHFVEQVKACGLDQAQARNAVQEALTPYLLRRGVKRQRADNETIKALIRQQWKATGGRGSILLRYLRDEALISCEQRRFAELWCEVREQMARNPIESAA